MTDLSRGVRPPSSVATRRRGDADRLGVKSLETGVQLLQALMDMGQPAILKALAERAGMSPPKALRYLVSACRVGLALHHSDTGAYSLGPVAIQFGLAALREVDVLKITAAQLADIRDELGCTTGLAIWGSHGPSFVMVEEMDDVALITVRVGAVMPILSSATGRMYGAHMTPQLIAPMIKAELPLARLTPPGASRQRPTLQAARALLEDVRRRGVARVRGEMNVGVHALAVPIFDHADKIAAVLAALGAAGTFDIRYDGVCANGLLRRAESISKQLGHRAREMRRVP